MQSFGDPGTKLTDISIRVNECGRLFDELKNDKAFNFECFRQNSYCKVGAVGKYISRNFRDYIFNGNVDPRHEGLILTLYYTDESAPDAIVSRPYAQKPAVLDNSGLLEEAPITEVPSPRFFLSKPEAPEEDRSSENAINGFWYK